MSIELAFLGGIEYSKKQHRWWDEYLASHSQATFFHRVGWKEVVERAFGHRTYYLYACSDDGIVGVLPLVHVNSVLFGNSLISTPFCVYGGILADSPAISNQLRERASKLAEELGVDTLELRNLASSESGWIKKDLYVTFRKTLPEDGEAVLPFIPNKQRAVVRKGIKAGLTAEEGWHGRRMYNVYAESLRDLGTPVFGRNYFNILRDVFGEDCRSLMIQHEGRDIAGVLSFYFRDQVLPYYAGSTAASRGLHAHGYMYWALMKNAVDQGVKIFDFGRSKKGTGSYSFKKNWGFTPEPLDYEYLLVKSKSIPEVNPLNPKYQYFIRAWKALPLPVANRFGPLLARSLG